MFPLGLPSPNLLHTFQNMCQELHSKLTGWNQWLPYFKAVATLLHDKHLQKRLIATCVLNTPWAWLANKFDVGAQKAAFWRWGTVHAILPKILAVKRLLQNVWDPNKFGNPQQLTPAEVAAEAAEREGDSSRISLLIWSRLQSGPIPFGSIVPC